MQTHMRANWEEKKHIYLFMIVDNACKQISAFKRVGTHLALLKSLGVLP